MGSAGNTKATKKKARYSKKKGNVKGLWDTAHMTASEKESDDHLRDVRVKNNSGHEGSINDDDTTTTDSLVNSDCKWLTKWINSSRNGCNGQAPSNKKEQENNK